ncbi:MAG: SpaH/EbpB family LPXTG-anchored major pilin [Microbacteriaceae bacterium]
MKRNSLRRLLALTGTTALALAGTVALGTAAHAAVGPDQRDAPTEGTLTINKYSGSPVGAGETPDPANLLDGVEFTVSQVGTKSGDTCSPLDLTDAAQWKGLKALFDSAPVAPKGDFCLVKPAAVQSTVDGTTTFDLAVGIYFVEETDPGSHNIVSPVPSFYVSIPTAETGDGNGWNYNVVADPKNQIMDLPSKTIETDQKDLVVGDNVAWNITVPVPTLNNNETFTTASVRDVLDSRLGYESSALSVNGTTLTEGTHYTVDTDGVTWNFTKDGLAELDKAMGENLSIRLVTSVNSVGDGSVPNDDYSSEFNGSTVPGEKVPYTYWGQLSIFKHDDSRSKLPLQGAEFKVFATDAQGVCAATAPADGALATGVSDKDGAVQWNNVSPASVLGLWVANSEDGPLSDPERAYCVYETKVPAGHTAVPFENKVTIKPGESQVFELDVQNARTTGPNLPLTGAGGTLALTIGGLLIIAAGLATITVAKRRKAAAL